MPEQTHASDTRSLFHWRGGLRLAGSPWWWDSRVPVSHCFVSHAHSDHLPRGAPSDPPDPSKIHGIALCTPATAAIGRYRSGLAMNSVERDYGQSFGLDEQTVATLLPAGHVLGSAMLHVRRGERSVLYTGDYKLRKSRTVPQATPVEADELVMESTFGSPHFRFPPAAEVEARLIELCHEAIREGKQPIVYGYSLGKAQEIIKILVDGGLRVTQHGAVAAMSEFYERFGVDLGPIRRYRREDFAGEGALDFEERGVLVAPPGNARSAFTEQFGDRVCRIVVTGWSLLPNAIYRYGVDHALPLSDHGDFDELIETIRIVKPKRIFTHHGFRDFPDHLARHGITAELARPEAQMRLF